MFRFLLVTVLSSHFCVIAADSDCFSPSAPQSGRLNACQQITRSSAHDIPSRFEAGVLLIALYTKDGDFTRASQWDAELARQFANTDISPSLRYNYLRRSGILAYRKGNYPQALKQFSAAATLASLPLEQAKSSSDTGTAHMAMGNFAEAISSFQASLAIKQTMADDVATAVTLNNLGNVYLKMSEWQAAEQYFRRAAGLYKQANNLSLLAHTQENLARVLIKQNQYDDAQQILNASLSYFEASQDRLAQLRVLIMLADVNLTISKPANASALLAKANQLDIELGHSAQSVLLRLVSGKLLSQQGLFLQADALLNAGLEQAKTANDPLVVTRFYEALIDNAQHFHRWQDANRYMSAKSDYDIKEFQRQYNGKLAEIRAGFEFEQQQQAIKLLEKDKQISALQVSRRNVQLAWLTTAFGLLSLLAIWFFKRQQQRSRLERYRLQQQIEMHRAKVNELGISLESLRLAFGKVSQPMLIADNQNRVIFANAACLELLGYQVNDLENQPLSMLFPEDNQHFWSILTADTDLENHHFPFVLLTAKNGAMPCQLQVSGVASGEPIAVIQLAHVGDELLPQAGALLSEAQFHQQLVELMIFTLETWERTSHQSRIELAEQSGIWRVSVDEGRLRTRSLDKYLSVRTLPRRPRWREVLRTAHYVLAECELPKGRMEELSAKLDRVNQHLHASALLS
ncbi:tetratricopeptide repeat protein [Shewanella sp. GXUN23E]|uniref:tetratricopeptide repeat protein n=1 Tax=Shewanella sp. GXUN23E TaxID=3422498 RepID=UPI003D7C729B